MSWAAHIAALRARQIAEDPRLRDLSLEQLAAAAGVPPALLGRARAEHDAGVIYARLLAQADELERSVPPDIRRAANLASVAAYPDGKSLPFSGALALGEYARILYLRRYLNLKKDEQ